MNNSLEGIRLCINLTTVIHSDLCDQKPSRFHAVFVTRMNCETVIDPVWYQQLTRPALAAFLFIALLCCWIPRRFTRRLSHGIDYRSMTTLTLRQEKRFAWWSGVVVSALASTNEVNQRRARLVLRWPCPGSIPGAGHLFRYLTNQPPTANSAFHPSGVGKWVPASTGKAKAGMVHSVSGWTRGVQVKLLDPLRTHAIPEHLSTLEVRSRRGAIQIHVYLYLTFTFYRHFCI